MKDQTINEQLMVAVSGHNLAGVRDCLEGGADSNYTIEADEECSDGIVQPTTPLQLVMFRISDCMLDDGHLQEFVKITTLLLCHGADPEPAIKIAEARYGTYDANHGEEGPFMEILDKVHSRSNA